MNFLRVVVRSLAYHWRMQLVVALGVAAATAALVGALVVGDSVRGSLRHLTLDRLGMIDEVLVVDHFFRRQLVDQLVADTRFRQHYRTALGAIMFSNGTAERRTARDFYRAANINVIAAGTAGGASGRQFTFWELGSTAVKPRTQPGPGEVVVNRALAEQLHVQPGDRITVRLPRPEDIPADSPLGKKTDRIRSLPRLTIIDIVPDEGLGAFALRPSQRAPLNAYLALATIQNALRCPGKINAILVAGNSVTKAPDARASQELAAALRPSLEDLGLVLKHPRLIYSPPDGGAEQTIYDYYSISSQRMILPPEVEQAAARAFSKAGGQPVFTYLANLLETVAETPPSGGRAVPYSMVTAIDPSPYFQLQDVEGRPIERIGADEIVLTDWTASQMAARVGDRVRITFFKPETTHGQSEEATAVLRVAAITRLGRPRRPYLPRRQLVFKSPPTMANDPDLTPEVAGVTDQRSIDAWEVPFTIDYKRIKPADDKYWRDYGTTPKAFVALSTGRRLWRSRFGDATSYRIPAASGLSETVIRQRLLAQLAKDGHRLGFEFIPIKRRQLQASSGNTPFDVLFVMLSFFVIAAALMLVAILFRLVFEQRARDAGLLLAVGWRMKRVRALFLFEGVCVSVLGGALGIGIGLGYSRLILAALSSKSWWLGAVGTSFLQFYWTGRSLAIGFAAGSIVGILTIAASLWRVRDTSACRLLRGLVETPAEALTPPSKWSRGIVWLLGGLACALVIASQSLDGEARAGAFVGAGASLLGAWLGQLWIMLRSGGKRHTLPNGALSLVRLAARSAARNPLRSTLTIGLIATASFLIVAMSAFRLRPTEYGTGGFNLVAESSQSVLVDLDNPQQRADLFGEQAAELRGTRVFSFRLRPGDDASCGNLYQAAQPRILGVPDAFIAYYDEPKKAHFQWVASAATTPAQRRNPWRVLQQSPETPAAPIPVVIDHDMAVYSLHLYKGIGEEFTYFYDGRPVRMRVAGLLSISILHGNLLMADRDFRRQFPALSGYRYFLIKCPPAHAIEVERLLEETLTDEGFDAMAAEPILRSLLAIQNTYLRTFQSLGALGLLLGTFGLAVVQWRNVLERRGEIALMRATGFSNRRLRRLLLIENIGLLLVGLASGAVAAYLAVLPHVLQGGASVPFVELSVLLLVVLSVGIVAGAVAAWATLRTPLLATLREER